MKLYSVDLSPYASRVRIAIYAKNLPIEIVAPPGGLGSAEFNELSPLGKVPALEVDGRWVVESEVINEFLEDRFPTPPLRPADPLARARMRELSRFADLYLSPPLTVLFAQMNPATRDAKLVAEKLAELDLRLDQLESLVVAGPHGAGASLSLADCTLAAALLPDPPASGGRRQESPRRAAEARAGRRGVGEAPGGGEGDRGADRGDGRAAEGRCALSAELDAWARELRGWLAANIPAWWRAERWATPFEVAEHRFPDLRAWQRRLFDAGYMGLRWPREYGGQGLSLGHELVRAEEFQRAKAPPVANVIGLTLCAPALLESGSEAQKRRFLANILSAEEIWVQGYSEPGAGSDLAGLQTRAELVDGAWLVNGQKIWTTNGMHGDWIFCLVRTIRRRRSTRIGSADRHEVARRRGAADRERHDRSRLREVFFTGVRVLVENMVGALTQGWQIANQVLRHERGADISVLRYGDMLAEIADRARSVRRGRCA
jgi:glutathione S-transferase